MADYTSNLDTLAAGQAGKEITANALFDAGSPATAFGRRANGCVGLTWAWYGGVLKISGVPTRIANGSTSLPASTSALYLELDPAAGAISYNTTGWTSGRAPLYRITTGAASVTSYLDFRMIGINTV